jgi:hypothetical protein
LQVVRSDCNTARPTDNDTMIGQMYQYIHACELCCYYEIAKFPQYVVLRFLV